MRSVSFNAMLVLLVAALAGVVQPAHACIIGIPFEIEDIRQADAVFVGEPIQFERVSPGWPISPVTYGLLTLRVSSVLKGRIAGDVQLYWENTSSGVPDRLYAPEQVIVAAIRAEPDRFPNAHDHLLHVLRHPCSSPFFLPYSQESENNIRAILRGEPVEVYDYHETDQVRRLVPTPIFGWKARIFIWAGVPIFVIVLATALIVIRLRNRRRQT